MSPAAYVPITEHLAFGGPPPGTNPALFLAIFIPIIAITAIVIGVAMHRRGKGD
jgi:hypothetical protein